MASSEGAMGTVVAGITQFGGGALAAGSQIGMMAVAMKGLNLAMLANPIGITVAAIAVFIAAMVALWKNSQTAREVMSTMFAAIGGAVLMNIQFMVKAAHVWSTAILTAVGIILNAMAKIPGPTQDNAKKAAKAFDDFRKGVDHTFDAVEGKLDAYSDTVKNLPKKIKLQGDERDLAAKLRTAQRQLRQLPRDKRTRVLTDITRAQRNIAAIQARLRGIKDEYVSVFVSEVQRDRATANRGRAMGGIIGAASGGARGGWTMVGEQGRELVRLAPGSTVIPHGGTENMMKAGGIGGVRGGQMTIEIRSGGSRLDDLLVQLLRKAIRDKGGDVQTVLGKA